MKIGVVNISAASLAVLVIQLALVGSIAAKYAWQRAVCPRVWTRTILFDPDLVMRGRYLSLRLSVNTCEMGGAPVSGNRAAELIGVVGKRVYSLAQRVPIRLVVRDHRLMAVQVPEAHYSGDGLQVWVQQETPCDRAELAQSVNFYIAEHAQSPIPLTRGQELWVEVTVPPKGPPRPIQLALKEANGTWTPLAFQ